MLLAAKAATHTRKPQQLPAGRRKPPHSSEDEQRGWGRRWGSGSGSEQRGWAGRPHYNSHHPPRSRGTSPFIASRTTPPSCALRRMRSSALPPPPAPAAWLWRRRRRRQDGAHQVRPVGPSQAPHGPRCRPPASLRLPGHRGGLRSALGPRSGAALQGRGPLIGPGPAEGAGPRGAEGGLGGGVFGEGVRGSRRRL